MKVLTLDIETSPNLADVWGLWKQNVGLAQLRQSTEMLCFAAKWEDEGDVQFFSQFEHGRTEMVAEAWKLLDEADVVVHFNGRAFDIPHINREILVAGMAPPRPFAEVDLLQVVKRRFRFPSNKLDYVARELLKKSKVEHIGHALWQRCIAGDPEAWAQMEEYNRGDVLITEELYHLLLPWIEQHPHRGLYGDHGDACPNCGSDDIRKRGLAYTRLGVYQQYRCENCGRWSRGGKRFSGADAR